jgi:hypothetical protein
MFRAVRLPETCGVSCRSKFGKLVHLVGFIIKKNICQSFTVKYMTENDSEIKILMFTTRDGQFCGKVTVRLGFSKQQN